MDSAAAFARGVVLPVGAPVLPAYQIGRDEDIERLRRELHEHEHTVLSSDRRTGKTTVALAALDRLASDGVTVCAVDCRQTPSDDVLAAELDAQRVANQGTLRQTVDAGLSFSGRLWRSLLAQPPADEAEDALVTAVGEAATTGNGGSTSVAAALQALTAAAGDDGAVVFFDEAHEMHAREAAVAVAAAMRDPDSPLTFVFAGSDSSMMDTVFGRDGMLRVQGAPFELHAIAPADWVDGLADRLQRLGVLVDRDGLADLVDATGGRPYRTMLAANRTHQLAQDLDATEMDRAMVGQAVRRAKQDRRWPL